MFTLCSWRDKKYKEILQCNYLNQGSWMKVIHSLCLWKKNAAILKFLVNWPLKWKYLNSNTEESFFQTLLIQTYSTSLKFHWHPVVSKTKHSKTKTEARSTQNSKTKHPKLENEAPKSRKRSTLDRKRSTQNSKTKHPKPSKTKHPKLENEAP